MGGRGGGRTALMEAGSALGMAGTGEGTLPAGRAYPNADGLNFTTCIVRRSLWLVRMWSAMLDEDSKSQSTSKYYRYDTIGRILLSQSDLEALTTRDTLQERVVIQHT